MRVTSNNAGFPRGPSASTPVVAEDMSNVSTKDKTLASGQRPGIGRFLGWGCRVISLESRAEKAEQQTSFQVFPDTRQRKKRRKNQIVTSRGDEEAAPDQAPWGHPVTLRSGKPLAPLVQHIGFKSQGHDVN